MGERESQADLLIDAYTTSFTSLISPLVEHLPKENPRVYAFRDSISHLWYSRVVPFKNPVEIDTETYVQYYLEPYLKLKDEYSKVKAIIARRKEELPGYKAAYNKDLQLVYQIEDYAGRILWGDNWRDTNTKDPSITSIIRTSNVRSTLYKELKRWYICYSIGDAEIDGEIPVLSSLQNLNYKKNKTEYDIEDFYRRWIIE